jgi:membrane dipeptidase
VAAFLACEGGDFLQGDAGRLDEMHADGVRSVTLVHYHPNELGDLQTSPAQHDGLSAAGKAVVRRMNRLKMVIDVSHATFETTRDVAALTSAPIMLSHGILKSDGPRPLAERAVTVEHARLVAATGGMIGVWPSGYNASFDEFVQNTVRMIDAVGIDHVGLGTDMDGNFRPVLDRYSQVPRWLEGLKAQGLRDDDVRKVAGGNAQRLLAATF